ncbi:hypothetical protein C8D91_1729 [Marinicella litoralis]|uniref:START domain-containing protein n=2 Tax=Marinicella litoralis TaxID=644220 RepID=A0A4V3DI53_9GAMM|nr:hypothetical protein C8D91_1729 [Marinicella litoralis]
MVLGGCILLSNALLAENWQLKIDDEGIQVFQQQKHDQYHLLHTKGEFQVTAQPATVFALLRDLTVCQQWIYGCLEAKRENEWVHMVFKGPLWFSDRDVVFDIEVTFLSEQQQWLIQLTGQPQFKPNDDYVRIDDFNASWLLTPIDQNQLLVTYELYMDPGIKLKSGVNKYNRDVTFRTLKNMREMLNQSPYIEQKVLPEKYQKMSTEE